MFNLAAADLSARDQYKLLAGSIIPRPIAWITTQNTTGLINLAPFIYDRDFKPTATVVSSSFT